MTTAKKLEVTSKESSHVNLYVDADEKVKDLVHATIEVRDQENRLAEGFSPVHEKLMHLAVVSNNLQHFDHVHPTFVGKGRFEADIKLPFGGEYTFFSGYQREGMPQEMSVSRQFIGGDASLSCSIDTTLRSQTLEETKVSLSVHRANNDPTNDDSENSESIVRAGEEITIQFSLQQKNSDKPVQDLQQYLGAIGHLIIVKQPDNEEAVLSHDDYMHVHSDSEKADGQIDFTVSFPEAGTYKMWGEFKRNNRSVIPSFGIKVEESY